MPQVEHNPGMRVPADPLTIAEVGQRLNLSRWRVSGLCREGVFPGAVKLPGSRGPWLVPASELPRYAAWCATREGKRGRPPKGPPKGPPKRRRR